MLVTWNDPMKTTCKILEILVLLAGLAFIIEAQEVPDQNDPIKEAVRKNPMSPQLLLNLEQADRRLLPTFLEMLGNPADDAAPIRPFIEGEFHGPIPGSDPTVDLID